MDLFLCGLGDSHRLTGFYIAASLLLSRRQIFPLFLLLDSSYDLPDTLPCNEPLLIKLPPRMELLTDEDAREATLFAKIYRDNYMAALLPVLYFCTSGKFPSRLESWHTLHSKM